MENVGMAALAKHGLLHYEEGLMRASVRVVTIQTTFANRWMLEEERTALFSVALVTLVID